MPVKISTTVSNDPASFTITKQEFDNGRANFDAHYHCINPVPYTGQDFKVSWDQLANIVNNYQTSNNIPLTQVALRFYHCYDTLTNTLFARLNLCQMVPTDIRDFERPVWSLANEPQEWFDLSEGIIMPSNAGLPYMQQYLESFNYKPNPSESIEELLVNDGGLKFARSLTFPWQTELLEMYNDNGAPGNAFIHLASCSYTEPKPGDYAVKWPHGMVMYLEANGITYLDNAHSITIFSYKGADMSTTCPPKCDCYIFPNPILVTQDGSLRGY